MEKIIFLGLIAPILIFVLYLGGRAIMTGFSAKNTNKSNSNNDEIIIDQNETNGQKENLNNKNLTEELTKLNELLKTGVLTQEEFEKAKKNC